MVERRRAAVLRHMADIHVIHGRTAELACLVAALDAVSTGVARTVVLEGPPGIGKSTLLRALADDGRRRGFPVRHGRADEVGRRPFGPLLDALGDLGPSLPAELRDGRMAESVHDDLRYRAVDSLVEVVEAAAVPDGLVLLLDDLQWADAATVLALRAISRWVRDRPVLLALATRPRPRRPDLDRLLAILVDDGAEHLPVGPLDDDAARTLAGEVSRRPPDEHLEAVLHRAGGNPLYLLELLRHDPTDAAPPSLVRVVERGLADLSAAHRHLLQDAAVLGGTVQLAALAAVADLDIGEVARSCEVLVEAGVLVVDEGPEEELRFAHDVVRQALVESLSAPARAALHERAAWRLAAHGAPARRVADQLVHSRPRPGDRRAVDWLRRAAAEQRSSAPAVAVDLLTRAAELLDPAEPDRAAVLAELVEAEVRAGAVAAAIQHADEALGGLIGPGVRERLVVAMAEARMAAGDLDGVLAMARDTAPDELSAAGRSLLLALAANVHDLRGELDDAEMMARRALAATGHESSALEPATTQGRTMARLVLADVARLRGDWEGALVLTDRVRAEEEEHGPRSAWPPEVFAGLALHDADRLEEATAVVADGLRRGQRWGRVAYQPTLHTIAAEVLMARGRWDDALAEVTAAMSLADDVELRMLTDWSRAVAAELLVRRDEVAEAERMLAPLAIDDDPSGPPLRSRLVLAQALLLEARGQDDAARRLIRTGWTATDGRGPSARLLALDTVRMSLAGGEDAAAGAVATALAEQARGPGATPGLRGVARLCAGLVEGDVELLLEAVEVLRGSARVPDLHVARAQAGLALAERGDGRADGLLQQAVVGLEDLGARRESARIVAAARASGVVVSRPRDGRRPASGMAALTPAERDAARLAATGLTNPQIGERLFVSPRTVQSHLASTYRKLGIRSRVQLAALMSAEPPG